MCDFCHKHGEGKTWYLQARNYSLDLARSPGVKKRLEKTVRSAIDDGPKWDEQIRRLRKAPRAVRWLVNAYTDWDLKRNHHGQVVPLEDLRTLLSTVVTSVVLLPCVCRKGATGRGGAYCMAITTAPGVWDETCRQVLFDTKASGRLDDQDLAGLQTLTPGEALALLERFEGEGLVHSLWTFKSPFIGGLCNCDPATCGALRFLKTGLDVVAPGEYVAEVDREACRECGSRDCIRRCPFHAMRYDTRAATAHAEPARCYGCGLCRSVCPRQAISLTARPGSPQAALSAPA